MKTLLNCLLFLPALSWAEMDIVTINKITSDCKINYVEYIDCKDCANGNRRNTIPFNCWQDQIYFTVNYCDSSTKICYESTHVHDCRSGFTDPLSTPSSRLFIKKRCTDNTSQDYLFMLYNNGNS